MNRSNCFQTNSAIRIAIQAVFIALVVMVFATSASAKGKPSGGGGKGGGGKDTATIEIIAYGVVSALVQCEESLDANSTSVLCNKAPTGFDLGQVIVDAVSADPDCFTAGFKDGAIQLWANKDGTAEAWFRFHAFDRQGTEVLYVLEVYADGWGGTFPPETIDPPIFMLGDSWLLRTSNKRQGRYACTGTGLDSVDVSLARLP